MANWAIVVLVFVALAAGGAGGWTARGYYDGSVVSAADAAQSGQEFVDAGIEVDRGITAGRTETETAVERVIVTTRTVEVAGDCPPGRGPISADFADQLHELAKARADAVGGASRVP